MTVASSWELVVIVLFLGWAIGLTVIHLIKFK